MGLPSKAAIAAYWSSVPATRPFLCFGTSTAVAARWTDDSVRLVEHDVYACWACHKAAELYPLERAHLVPRSLGGSDDPSNLVLLCNSCHRKAPNTDDAAYMLEWVHGYADRENARAWAIVREATRLIENRLGKITREVSRRVLPGTPGFEKVCALLDERASHHYGETTNAATLAWAVEQVLTS